MANPRQRRKARSSTHRPVSHSRNAKRNLKKTPPVKGPKVLQSAWNKRKTLNQNYLELGLLHSLNPLKSGGTEHQRCPDDAQIPDPTTNYPSSPSEAKIPQTFGKIIRDSTGTVISVETPEESDSFLDAETAVLPDPCIDAQVQSKWALGEGYHTQDEEQMTAREEVVNALEQMSTPQTALHSLSFAITGVGARYTSTGEAAYLQKLVNKHGEDVEGMAKDRKLNPEQRTVGQLRTALRRVGLKIGGSG